jgi:trans-2,3-dihydro-3-hydroxyanthranilate isomerase
MAGCGLEFTYLSVRPAAVARARVPREHSGVGEICVCAFDTESGTAHVRVFAPDAGVPEDPATGAAALGLGVFLVASGLLPGAGDSSFVVHQGEQLHRPSVLGLALSAADGAVHRITVSGSVVPIARGEIAVPPFVG